MNKFTYTFCIFMLSFLMASCSTELNDYEKNDRPFDIKQYFNGKVIAWGMVQNYSNKVQRRFCVEIIGTWQGDTGTLAEKFYFNDGEITYRNWHLTKQLDGSYTGTAEDIIGTAIGKHQGFAFQFQYSLQLKLEGGAYEVAMDDWMYQLDQYRVMNKTAMSKLGIKVAEITLFFDKQLPVKSCAQSG